MTDEQESRIGSVTEEAAKLFAALSGWSREQGGQYAGAASSFADALHDVNDHLANSDDCRYCPVCRGIRTVRQLSPEVREHLSSAASSTLQALAALIHSSGNDSPYGANEAQVQRIDIEDF